MGDGTGSAVLVHVGTNNAEKEGTSERWTSSDREGRCSSWV